MVHVRNIPELSENYNVVERALSMGSKNSVQVSALPFTSVITGSHLSFSEPYFLL